MKLRIFGGKTYILPSSIHECLAVDTHVYTVEELKTMVRDINSKPDLVGADFYQMRYMFMIVIQEN